jgi:hypothetical protein
MSMDANEYKLAKTLVKTSFFLQFLLHIPIGATLMAVNHAKFFLLNNTHIEKSKMNHKNFQYQGFV